MVHMGGTHTGLDKVAETFHLERRNGVYYYRRRVPDHAVAAIGRRTIKYSLETSDKSEARKRREVEDLKWRARFESLSAEQTASSTNDHGRPLSRAAAVRLVREYVERMDRQSRERYERAPADSGDQKTEMRIDAEVDIGILRDPDDRRGDEWTSSAMEELLTTLGVNLDGSAISRQEFAELIRRGLLELGQRRAARLGDKFSRSFFDALFDPTMPPPVAFGELADEYLRAVHEDAEVNGVSRKRVDKVEANVALIREIVDEKTPVSAIDYDACLRVRSILSRMPANRTKFYGNLSLDAAIAKAKADGRAVLSTTTQGQYLETLRNILELAALKRLLPNNPAQSLRPLKRDDTSPSDKRRPFSLDQIKAFFTSEFYQRCKPGEVNAYSNADRDWRFWLPLLCLFMGMRPNEACQLLVTDIRQTKAGTWYVDVASTNDDEDVAPAQTKTLKTAASRRRIPVHPELIAIGFLDFVKSRQTSSTDQRLLRGLKPDQYGNLATYALQVEGQSPVEEPVAEPVAVVPQAIRTRTVTLACVCRSLPLSQALVVELPQQGIQVRGLRHPTGVTRSVLQCAMTPGAFNNSSRSSMTPWSRIQKALS